MNMENNIQLPEFLEVLLKEQYGEEICNNILEGLSKKRVVSMRVNTLKTTKEELKKALIEKNINVEDGILEDFLILDKVRNIENMKEFKEGLFTVQDEAAGLTALILNPKKEEKILDACSSPGGKTTYIAQIVDNNAEIEAWDLHESRIKLVEQNAKRLGIDIIKTKVNDATKYKEEYFEKFDKILLDVPCLGLGVLKRKPDIKWQRNQDDINTISKIQYEILNICSNYLKQGGELVYSTCSILNSENKEIIFKFLENNSNFKIKEIEILQDKNKTNNYFKKYIVDNKFIQVYQNEKTDGFFICKLKKL